MTPRRDGDLTQTEMTTIYEIRVYRRDLGELDAKLERMCYDDVAKATRNRLVRWILPDPILQYTDYDEARAYADAIRARVVQHNSRNGYGTRIEVIPVHTID